VLSSVLLQITPWSLNAHAVCKYSWVFGFLGQVDCGVGGREQSVVFLRAGKGVADSAHTGLSGRLLL
jgi:hypothetical protein